MGDSIIARRIYRDYVVSIYGRETLMDLTELDMLDFDVILGMDWLHSCYVPFDCKTQKVNFQFSNEPVIEWEGSSLVPKVRFISYLRTRKLISKGCLCLYHLVQVKDSNSKGTSLQSVPMVHEFPEVFPDDLLGVSPNRKI